MNDTIQKTTINDFLFFLVVAGVPSSFFGLVNEKFFYIPGLFDLRLLSWLLSLLFLFFYFRNIKYIKNITAGNSLLWVVCFLAFVFLSTLLLNNVSFKEAFTIFRADYFTPISCLALMLYMTTMDSVRLNRFFNWIILAMSVQGLFFIVYYFTGLSVFSVSIYETMDKARYFLAYPIFNSLVFNISVINLLFNKKIKWFAPLMISIVSMFLISTRSVLFSYVIYLSIISFLYVFTGKKTKTMTMIYLFLMLVTSQFIFSYYFKDYSDFFSERLNEIFVSSSLKDVANYNFRLKLIDDAIQSNLINGTLLFGNGYVRFSESGDYDLTLGGDSSFAGVIYTEGVFGIIIRMLPIIIILIKNIKEYLFIRKEDTIPLNIISIAMIVPGIIMYAQTAIFKNYNSTVFFLFALEIIKLKQGQYIDNNNHNKKPVNSVWNYQK
ncbi:MAG: hypothetical protein DKM50_01910 [Candidatus Margulisiibacteriota bacterium]|nr:MAG: hypothetical protein A2X43_13235 [Candidatus Margulisbacteria bacterium GWD2_39_127]OGI04779.1 MAG: hypothetical protein A2X42_10760 [Candidatus Margulisbacteria bacterium GWF2_38_17]OGI05724.1 MAG: hypothetical protein A2X41_03345 [Candidatus Margulisbacteria bacterium GWE2_39_32]PZM83659.1 MAG: hypothetical protein DKM50_01910 [Candidatus Margulisiibacteriota bacterium]HAR62077.1 hypothetical protein [Candidatus Margulisiibacteriota bacterium]